MGRLDDLDLDADAVAAEEEARPRQASGASSRCGWRSAASSTPSDPPRLGPPVCVLFEGWDAPARAA